MNYIEYYCKIPIKLLVRKDSWRHFQLYNDPKIEDLKIFTFRNNNILKCCLYGTEQFDDFIISDILEKTRLK